MGETVEGPAASLRGVRMCDSGGDEVMVGVVGWEGSGTGTR